MMKEVCKETINTETEKLKVTYARIIVGGTVDKPYFEIEYHEVGKDYDNIGFGSYYLKNVFKWRDEYLEIISNNDEDVCEWTRRINNFTTSCGEDFVPLMRGYQFCPYCGKRMKVRTKDGE